MTSITAEVLGRCGGRSSAGMPGAEVGLVEAGSVGMVGVLLQYWHVEHALERVHQHPQVVLGVLQRLLVLGLQRAQRPAPDAAE